MPERFHTALAEGRHPLVAWMWNPSPLFCEVTARAGFDAIGFDLQHGAIDFDHLYGLMAVVSGLGVTPMVRIPAADDLGWVTRVLDAGARTVVCPNVDTAQQAEAFAQACKYPPLGTRGFGPVRPSIGKSVGYAAGVDAYSLTDENASILAIAQIESALAIENLEEIVSVAGIDGLFPGPLDMSLSLYGELVTDLRDPRQLEPLRRIAEAAHAHDLTVGLPPFTPENIPMLVAIGTDWFQLGNDFAWMTAAAGATVTAAQDALAGAGVPTAQAP